MINKILKDTEICMNKYITSFQTYINKVRSGKVSPELINLINVTCNGIIKPLRYISNICIENNNTLSITSFDSTWIPSIEKSIKSSNLNINVYSSGNKIYATFAKLSMEKRINLIKMLSVELERNKILIRNIRRESNNQAKILHKEKKIDKNELHILQKNIQKLTDDYICKLVNMFDKKKINLLKD
ncbi:MAG: ribosome-recycling factor [Enterobacterales bacterium]